MPMSEELKPCPFCGEKVTKNVSWGIECIEHSGNKCPMHNRIIQIDLWNTRTNEYPIDQQTKAYAELKESFREVVQAHGQRGLELEEQRKEIEGLRETVKQVAWYAERGDITKLVIIVNSSLAAENP